jgi:uncharacterized membrane protein YeaQ/YmgE (transglycosylase-associated protein family)
MELEQAIILIFTGLIAGWLAGLIMKGRGFGVLGNIIIGVIGAVFGGWLFDLLGVRFGGEFIGDVARAMIGAIILIALLGFVRKK